MRNHLLRHALTTIPVLFSASILTFLRIRLVPGDPAAALAGPVATREDLQSICTRLGLVQPLAVQYLYHMRQIFTGGLGYSYFYKQSFMKLVIDTIPATLELSSVAFLISLALALPIGVLSATRRNSWIDHSSMFAP